MEWECCARLCQQPVIQQHCAYIFSHPTQTCGLSVSSSRAEYVEANTILQFHGLGIAPRLVLFLLCKVVTVSFVFLCMHACFVLVSFS
jgi:hypothetical protein